MKGFEEFLGKCVTIERHSDCNIIGMSGVVVDETRETVVIETNGLKKIVIKRPAKFMFENGEIVGSKIAYRPQDRIKKVKA